jgi:hypothetical protein
MWQNEMVRIVRHIIGDLTEPYNYDDARLEECLLVSAQLVLGEVDFSVTYTIDVDQCTFSPDPTEGTKDQNFILLVTLKTACLISQSEYKTKVRGGSGMVVRDGPTSIDTKGNIEAYKDSAKTVCQQYEDSKNNFLVTGDAGGVGRGILGPFSSDVVWTSAYYRNERC